MKLKKVLGILVISIIAMCMLVSGKTYSAEASYMLGITNVRKSGGAYEIQLVKDGNRQVKKIWKIVSYPSGNSINYDNDFYCLRAEHGFAINGTENVTTIRKEYNTKLDMKTQKTEVIDKLKRVNAFQGVDANSTYNKILWVIDNMYLPNKPGSADYKEILLENAGITDSDYTVEDVRITDDDIEVIQQLVLWHYTNSEDSNYNSNILPELYFNNNSGQDSNYKNFEDLYNDPENNGREGRYRQEEAELLYTYFITNADKNSNYTSPDSVSPLTLDKNRVEIKQENGNYVIGPIKIQKNSELAYTIKQLEFLDGDGKTFNYTLLNSNKTPVSSEVKDLIGNDFYISLPENTEIETINFNFKITYNKTSATYYTTSDSTYTNEQPVVLIEKTTPEYTGTLTVKIPKKPYFDLALRKFITKINETEYNREPIIDISGLKTGATTTATYTHPKNPLAVQKGDIVKYKIRIYNEGQAAGYAKEITDYLPTGLELVEDSEINQANGWTKVVGTNKIITTKLADQLIPAFDGTTLSYKDVEVECRVIAKVKPNDQTLKNIAEISKDADQNGNTVDDRDSDPNNVITNNYTTQQEDDDDFEDLVIKAKHFDLALRKFITAINGIEPSVSRVPVVDITGLKNGTATTAIYTGPKTPVPVRTGDIVTYTIRVYNEGEIDGYAEEITDHLPPQLEFLPDDEENISNGWIYDENDTTLRTVRTTHLSRQTDTDNIIEKFDGTTLKYKDITIKCKVKEGINPEEKITNIADITKFADEDGDALPDRDSKELNVVLPEDKDLPEYKQEQIDKGDVYIPGQEDDDDFEKLKVQIFDLALRKFITKVEDKDITTRLPKPQISAEGKITYNHPKDPVEVRNSNIVTYTIRVYNEGDLAGYAEEIKDNLPEGLLYLPENETNTQYRWKMIDKDGKETKKVEEAVKITTDYLSKAQEKAEGENLIKAFNKDIGITNNNPDYKDVKVAFKVIEPATSERILINTAEISEDADEAGKPIEDIDSTPDNNKPEEDDQDIEKVKLVYFDLALRKFVTKVSTTDINNRVPKPTIGEDGKIKYEHTKEPIEVAPSDIVIYTIRVYNEGKIAGYAEEVKDDLPQGLLYLPENETNTQYKWKMIDKDGKETKKVEEAVKITTDYLSKANEKTEGENLIKAFNKEAGITNNNPDYRDVKIAFKVVEPETSDRIIINTAEISEDADEEGKPVEDIDSTPDNNKPEEDDQDIEKIKVKYFDLSLKKWVTQAIVIKDGKQTVTNTGHTGDENPEPVVKVDLKKSDIKKVTVKFAYKIKVTNEGQIDGYAKEVKDYIPNGLKFDPKDNPQWKQISDKEVVTEQLANTLLKPGQSATVDIILTWENNANNMGIKVNTAEISKDYNESNTPDIDSTPNNKVPGEDDIDDAPVMLVPRTGQTKLYIGLTTLVLVIFACGVYTIKKYVLDK